MEIAYSRSSVGYLLGKVQIWGEAKVCGFLCLYLPDSTFFYLGVPKYVFQVCSLLLWGLKTLSLYT